MWAKKQIVYTCTKLLILQHTKETFEDTKEVISQYNGEKKNRQKGQAIIHKTLHRKIMIE